MTIQERIATERLAGQQAQAAVNRAAATAPIEVARATAAIHGAYQLGAWPQYEGHFEDYTCLVRIKHRVRTKMGVAFEPGDYAITNAKMVQPGYLTVYSLRNGIDTSVSVFHYEVIG
jgi:hypothetical protein